MSAADVESKLEECLGGGVPEDISNDNIIENEVNEIKPKAKTKTIEKKTGDDHFLNILFMLCPSKCGIIEHVFKMQRI